MIKATWRNGRGLFIYLLVKNIIMPGSLLGHNRPFIYQINLVNEPNLFINSIIRHFLNIVTR